MRLRSELSAIGLVTVTLGFGSTGPSSAEPIEIVQDDRMAGESVVEAGYTVRFLDRGTPVPVIATVTVPGLDCGPDDTGVVTSVGLVEVPYRFAGGRIAARCRAGVATYGARLASSTGAGETVDGLVEAGDRIKITAVWNGSVGLPLVDVTMTSVDAGWRAATQFSFFADGFNGAVLRQTPLFDEVMLPVPAYDGARVARARLGGQDLDDLEATRTVLVDAEGNRVVVPGKIKAGGAFKFSYVG